MNWRILAALIAGVVIGLAVPKPAEPLTSGEFHAIPDVKPTCTEWHVQETAPDFYWDTDENLSSTADYYTVSVMVGGVIVESAHAQRGEMVDVPAGDVGSVTITYWDSDRPTEPEVLETIGVNVPSC